MSVASRLLVAGAGTGKTYQLVAQMRALLDAKIPAARLAAITFSEAAAGELQERIRRDIPEHPQALEATISTIHGFCAALLRERPIEAGVTPQFSVLDGLGRALLLEDLWQDWIEEQLDRPGPVAQGRIDGVDREKMKKFAFALLEHRDPTGRLAPGELAHALVAFRGRYDEAKRKLGALDFDDLLWKTRDLLREHRGVREAMRGRFEQILVDEFQDTDPAQSEVLWLLVTGGEPAGRSWSTPPQPGRLFLVGDPRQSIYRFRGADLETFERACASLEEAAPARREPLLDSRRSIPKILSWVNHAFGVELGAVRKDAESPEGGVFVLLPGSPLEGGIEKVRAGEAAAIAAFLRERIGSMEILDKESKTRRLLEAGDCAILMRSLSDASIYEEALIEAGIPVAIEGAKAYFARREVKFLASWLRAVENPLDRVAVVAALRSPLFGVSDRDLAAHAAAQGGWDYREPVPKGAPGAIESAFRRLAADRSRKSEGSIAAFLERSFEESGALGLLRLQPGGEQRVANWLHTARTARELESRGPLSFSEFVEYFSRNESELREEALPSAIEGREAARILTMHRSKGLEFPLVVLADLTRGPSTAKDLLLHARGADRLEYRFGEDLPASEGYEAAEREKDEAEAEESKRLLYVAATRARDALVIPRFLGGRVSKHALFGLLPASISNLDAEPTEGDRDGARFLRASGVQASARKNKDGKAGKEALSKAFQEREAFRRRLETMQALAKPAPLPVSPSSLAYGDGAAGAAGGGSSGGSQAGTAVHRALALGDWNRRESFSEILEREIVRTTLREKEAGHARRCLQAALRSAVFARALAAKRRFRELPFALRLGDQELAGQIDLAFEEENAWVVVDYKTDRADPAALAELGKRYKPQIDAYAQSLRSVLGASVKERILAFLAVGEEVSV